MNRIKQLRVEANMNQKQLAQILGIAQNTLSQYETEKRNIDNSILLQISDYFHVTTDYVLGKSDSRVHSKTSVLNKKDERQIEKILERAKKELTSQEGLMFDGDPASPEAIESILSAMELGLQAAKMKNKEKYTPKKYKKG